MKRNASALSATRKPRKLRVVRNQGTCKGDKHPRKPGWLPPGRKPNPDRPKYCYSFKFRLPSDFPTKNRHYLNIFANSLKEAMAELPRDADCLSFNRTTHYSQ